MPVHRCFDIHFVVNVNDRLIPLAKSKGWPWYASIDSHRRTFLAGEIDRALLDGEVVFNCFRMCTEILKKNREYYYDQYYFNSSHSW